MTRGTWFAASALGALAGLAIAAEPLRSQPAYRFDPAMLALQVALDRAGFSPGEIDGRNGPSTQKALAAYRTARGDPPASEAATVDYTITAEDVAGPFVEKIPADLVAQAALPALAYTSPLEAIAERFHTSPSLLRALNPEASFSVAGETLTVPDVLVIEPPARAPHLPRDVPSTTVMVSRSQSDLLVSDQAGTPVFYAPVTVGSEHDPLPLGEWVVTGVSYRPVFHYNPKLFWDADPRHSKATIQPGPNNPVGLIWIDLNLPHYGLHGTPEPSRVGRRTSHGCVRLTNWDAMRVAALVRRQTKVVFRE